LPTALASPIQSQVSTNAVLTSAQVAALSPAEQQQLNAARNNAALLEVATQQAYATTSSRFASVQTLINAIPTANDQKGILDLQARIQAEQGMLRTGLDAPAHRDVNDQDRPQRLGLQLNQPSLNGKARADLKFQGQWRPGFPVLSARDFVRRVRRSPLSSI